MFLAYITLQYPNTLAGMISTTFSELSQDELVHGEHWLEPDYAGKGRQYGLERPYEAVAVAEMVNNK